MAYTIAILGLGYVGVTSMACLAKLGHKLIGVDVQQGKVDLVAAGESPIQEPQVSELLATAHRQGLISATTDADTAIAESDLCLVCVGTPSRPDGSINTQFLHTVIDAIARVRERQNRTISIYMRSTSLPNVHEELMQSIASQCPAEQDIAYCVHPEFLREGQAVNDFFNPPKIVYGCSDESARAFAWDLYPGIEAPTVHTDPKTAALVKYADNCFHAVKVTFANEIGQLSATFGVDARAVMDIFCLDTKLNLSPYYLKPGMPYGGSCLPKDLRGVVSWARRQSTILPMLEQVGPSNESQLKNIIAEIIQIARPKVGVIGLAFKDNTDDLRESPMVGMVEHLLGKGYDVQIYDDNLIPDELIGANRNFALTSLPHLERMLVANAESLVAQSDVVVVTRLGLNIDFGAMPWRSEQVIIDLAGMPSYEGICAEIRGLYWPGPDRNSAG